MEEIKFTIPGDPVCKRFESKFIPTPECGCWIWTAGQDSKGYGRFFAHNKNMRAHRVSWEFYVGEIPAKVNVLHICDLPSCVNPQHLFLGNHFENMKDMAKKKRAKHPDQKGENHSQAKLNETQIREIRNCSDNNRKIALKYGVSDSMICQIKKRKKWIHVC